MKLNRVRRRRRDLLKVDRLIKLPDDVLLNILERVGTLDAVRTCVVSKQTLNLPALLSQIVVDLSHLDLHRKNRGVADMTHKILTTRSPRIPIRNLKLRFIMRGDDHIKIGRAFALAMATQKIDKAEFEILTKDIYYRRTDDADLLDSAKLFSKFIGECPDAFAGLTRLHLQNLRFHQPDIPNILTTCKRLESLSFNRCDAGNLSVLHVEHATLVELTFVYGKFLRVELHSLPKLQRMTLHRWAYINNPLFLGFVPRLSKLSLANAYVSSNNHKLSQLLVNVPSISVLNLDFLSGKIWVQPECPKLVAPVLSKLRLANLNNLPEECDIAWTMFFLEAAPSLEELSITVWDHQCQMESQKSHSEKTDVKWEPSNPDFKHKNLARLTIYGFQSDDNFMGYVRRTIQAAVNIKEVSLHDRKVCKLCTHEFPHIGVRPSSYPRTSEEVDLFRKKIAEAKAMASHAMIHFRTIGESFALTMATEKHDADELEIMTPRDSYHCTEPYLTFFAKKFNNFLCDCPEAFASLTRLQLKILRFGESDSDMPDILSTCKRLGSFCFFECEAGVRSVLHVEDARLLGLVISYGELKIVELNCLPKLQQMAYNNWSCYENPLVLGFDPQLPKLCLANEHPPVNILELSQLLPNVPLVSNLYLEFGSEKIWIRPECTEALAPVFTKLRCVNLDNLPQERDLAWTMFLLEAAPFIEELCIILRDHECQRESEVKWEPADPDFEHNNLARLTIYGFQSDDSFMGYVRRVIQAVLNIKEICLHGSKVCNLSAEKIPQVDVHPLSYPRTSEEEDSLRKMVTEVEAKEDSLRNVRASIIERRRRAIRDATSDLCLGGGEKRGERREAGYKLTAGCSTRPNKLCERKRWAIY